jgi:hypothetical protein
MSRIPVPLFLWVPLMFGMLSAPASAQGAYCLTQGQVNAQATQAFADMSQRTDPQLVQAMAGTWYSESPSPQTGQVSRLYVTYGADGSLSYQNQVCDSYGACSTYEGVGAWAAMQTGGGGFTGIQMITDQSRNQECTGFAGRFVDQNTIQSDTGGYSQRVR